MSLLNIPQSSYSQGLVTRTILSGIQITSNINSEDILVRFDVVSFFIMVSVGETTGYTKKEFPNDIAGLFEQ